MVTGRVMHKLREFIDRISNVWSGHRHILKVSNNGAELRRIGNGSAQLKTQGWCDRQWGGGWSGICHRSSGKEVHYILSLGKDQTERVRNYFNAKKVSQGTQALK